MGIGVRINDGTGTDRSARVSSHNAQEVSQIIPDVLPSGTPNRFRYLSGKLGTTGLDSGTVNQNVDGSVTPVVFFAEASPDFDMFIMLITIFLGDSGTSLDKFGGLSALSTGWDLFLTESGITTNIVLKAITGGDIIRQTGIIEMYGNAVDVNKMTDYNVGLDANTAILPLDRMIPGGFRLGRGMLDRITARVNDNLTGLSDLDVRIFGYNHIPIDPEEVLP